MSRLARWGLVAVGLSGALYTAGCWYFSSFILFFPTHTLESDRESRGIESLAQAGFVGVEPEEVRIPIDVGGEPGELVGWFFRHPDPAGCGAIAYHGHTGTRWGGLAYARLFWERGCHVMSYDARYHGESDGVAETYGYFEQHDGSLALDWMEGATGLGRGQMGLIGSSMGGATVLMIAAHEPELAFVAADAPYRTLRAITTHQGVELYGAPIRVLLPGTLALMNLRAGMDVDAVSPEAASRNIQAPVFLSHSLTDTYTPMAHSEAILAAVPHERRALYQPDWGSEHSWCIRKDYEAYRANMEHFIDRFGLAIGRRRVEETAP